MFKREDKNAKFWQRQNLSMGNADFNQFLWKRSQLVVAADNFLREHTLSPVLQSTLSKTWGSNWSLFTRWLTLWIAQIEGFVWNCCDTGRITQRHIMLKFVYSEGRRRKKNFNKLYMSTIDLTTLYIFLTSWMQRRVKKLLTNPFVMFRKK